MEDFTNVPSLRAPLSKRVLLFLGGVGTLLLSTQRARAKASLCAAAAAAAAASFWSSKRVVDVLARYIYIIIV